MNNYVKQPEFWERLKMFISNTEVNNSRHEEREMLLNIANEQFQELTLLRNQPILTKEDKMNEIFEKVCRVYEQDPKYILANNNSRHRDFVTVRQVSLYYFKKRLKYSLFVYGNFFKKDHATVLHSIKTVKNLMETDEEYKERTAEIFES